MTGSDKSPDAYRTISEVAAELGVPQHVLRFWETRFPSLKPLKRGGNRRYYRPADVVLLKSINRLLYTDGYTIKGVLKLIADGGLDGAVAVAAPVAAAPAATAAVVAPTAASAAVVAPARPGIDVAALFAIRDRLAGALAEARAG